MFQASVSNACDNPSRFCEFLLLHIKYVFSVIITQREQSQWLGELKESLKKRKISLDIQYSTSLHDREVRYVSGLGVILL